MIASAESISLGCGDGGRPRCGSGENGVSTPDSSGGCSSGVTVRNAKEINYLMLMLRDYG